MVQSTSLGYVFDLFEIYASLSSSVPRSALRLVHYASL